MDWKVFASIVFTLRRHDLDKSLWSRGECFGTAAVGTILELCFRDPEHRSLLSTLRMTRSFKSTLPSDKIYALLNLVSESEKKNIRVDYRCDTSLVYKDFAVRHMQQQHSLDILYHCFKSKTASPLKLPSWTPDWTIPCWHEPFIYHGLNFGVAGDSTPDFRFDENGEIMYVRGKILDEVAGVEKLRVIPRAAAEPNDSEQLGSLPFWRSPPTDKPWFKRRGDGKPYWESTHENYLEESRENRREWINNVFAMAFPQKGCTPEQFECLWRTFMCDTTIDGLLPPPEYGEYFSDWLIQVTATQGEVDRHWRSRKAASMNLDLRELPGDEDPFTEWTKNCIAFGQANARCYNRRFYRSVAGCYGWGVDAMEAGDHICLFYGACVPIILRQTDGGFYEIIGDAYLHGLMHGQGMTSEFEERMFQLV